jgi:hypothetical protein
VTFLVVTPLGLRREQELLRALLAQRVHVTAREALHSWATAATSLYERPRAERDASVAERFEVRWRELAPDDVAERWWLASSGDHARLVAAKPALRREFPGVPLDAPRPGEPRFSLHAFHVPDTGREDLEARRLQPYVVGAARRRAATQGSLRAEER